jgi:parvulin-like peptidyl-prolyl isomerase
VAAPVPPRPCLAPLAAALVLLAPLRPAAAQDYGTAARVNGVELSIARLNRYFEEFLGERGRSTAAIRSPSAFKELKRQALDQLVDQELLWQEAQRKKLTAPAKEVEAAVRAFRAQFPDERRRQLALERGGFTDETYPAWVRQQLSVARLVERELAPKVRVTRADARAFFDANPHLFTTPPQVRARHVLVRVAPSAGEGERAAARSRLEAVAEQARGGADFAGLARSQSDDATAPSGGDLGWFAPGQHHPTLDQAAFALEPGQLSAVFETADGLHLLRLEARRPEQPVPFEKAREEITRRLLPERRQEAVQARARALREAGKVEILIPL